MDHPVGLADILNSVLRAALGAQVDYRAIALPNERALLVEMREPEYLRGFQFTFREGEPLPPEIRARERVIVREPVGPNGYVTFDPELGTRQQIEYIIPNGLIEPDPFLTTRFENVTVPATATNRPTQAGELTYNGIRRTIEQVEARMTMATPAGGQVLRNTRTLEQEARLRELEVMYATVLMNDAQVAERTDLLGMAPCPIPLPPRVPVVRVRVHREDSQYGNVWQISIKVDRNNRSLPEVAVIRNMLPPADKHFLPARTKRRTSTLTYLRQALDSGLSPDVLHDSLRAWIVASESPANRDVSSEFPIQGADPETLQLLREQPAILEVGGRVFKLVPCHTTDVRPLIRRVKDRALAGARVEATGIVERGRADARVVVTEAEQRAATLRREIEELRRAEGNRAPSWVVQSGRPHYFRGGNWWVGMKVSVKVDHIRFMVREWNKILYWNALSPVADELYELAFNKLELYLRLVDNGVYTLEMVKNNGRPVTHISSYCCMELQRLPHRISNLDNLIALEDGLSRGMRVVNLNSPLARDTQNYFAMFRDQLPPMVISLLNEELHLNGYETAARFHVEHPELRWDREETIEQEADSTFSINDPRLIRPAVTPVTVTTNAAGIEMPAIPVPETRRG